MASVYVLDRNGNTVAMDTIYCVNEDLELQRILELNPDMIPGDQINPSDPRRWMVVKREMPVPDPGTGSNRWSIDLFFVDQDAMPTFIECKRYNDTRARREVVGQMLDYAANGHYYWSKEDIRAYAEEAATRHGVSLEDEIKRLQPEEPDSVDEFFQRVQDNLREGQIRLLFFMEAAPPELKSIVDFLNKQMERSEVLLVEARQYERDGTRIVVPILFGYTEEARQVKKTVLITTGQKRKWDKESFFVSAREKLQESQVLLVNRIYDKAQDLKCVISWGSGRIHGSFFIKWPHVGPLPVFTVYADGSISINFGSYNKTPEHKEFASFINQTWQEHVGISPPDDYERRYPNFKIDMWAGKADGVLKALESINEKFSVQL